MAKKKNRERDRESDSAIEEYFDLHPEIKRTIYVVLFFAITIFFILAALNQAGPVGEWTFSVLREMFGLGYYLIPFTFFVLGFSFMAPERKKFVALTFVGAILFVIAGLGFIDIVFPGKGGLTGTLIGALETPFGKPASILITLTFFVAAFLATLNRPVQLSKFGFLMGVFRGKRQTQLKISEPGGGDIELPEEDQAREDEEKDGKEKNKSLKNKEAKRGEGEIIESFNGSPNAELGRATEIRQIKDYVPPPLSLLASSVDKPTIGDLRANANIIKRTLESFGISVEMGEINVGPSVTRYTLKPAEGVKLSRITALNPDLALSLAAHPIRIEAPIPGKSLVGIEVPNKAAAVVRLGSLMLYSDFQKSGPLTFSLGRNVSGEPVFPDLSKMPHLLIAGATGSGKSITLHTILMSFLYKNSPQMLRMILVDPKRVELSIYNGIPHLMSPVIIENKRAIGALRWAIQEMDRRYTLLLEVGSRDIRSYNKSTRKDKLPYLLIVIDEMADLMSTYGREVEGLIIRLAQMARATGIHLILSTQRPSVEVITGLIKANITSRIALQVASQIDSRTILDTAGAEKLLGRGDLLFSSAELSKPQRVQGSFVTEDELKEVLSFIKDHNEDLIDENLPPITTKEGSPIDHEHEAIAKNGSSSQINFDEFGAEGDDDEVYEEAVELVRQAGKASASMLQRRLKLGYSRAARLLDMMEERGVVGPQDGAKPREVFL